MAATATRKVRVTVEVDAATWAKYANLTTAEVPADVVDYLNELVQTGRSEYAGLISGIRKG